MKYNDTLALLAAGKKVRLPEWTGYWYRDGDKTMAFTRTGDRVLGWAENSSAVGFMNRTDWEEVTEGLGFDFAVLALKAGKHVRRAGWNGKGMFIFMQKGYPDGIGANKNTADALGINEGDTIRVTPYLMMKAADGSLVTGWLASQTDILSNDWEIAE